MELVRERVIYLRMAMRFGKVFPALKQMELSLFHITATVSIALFLLIDNAMFLWMNGLLPMSAEMAAIAGRLEVQLWAGISGSFFLATLTNLKEGALIKLPKLMIIALDLPPIIYFLDANSPHSGPLLTGVCGSLSAVAQLILKY